MNTVPLWVDNGNGPVFIHVLKKQATNSSKDRKAIMTRKVISNGFFKSNTSTRNFGLRQKGIGTQPRAAAHSASSRSTYKELASSSDASNVGSQQRSLGTRLESLQPAGVEKILRQALKMPERRIDPTFLEASWVATESIPASLTQQEAFFGGLGVYTGNTRKTGRQDDVMMASAVEANGSGDDSLRSQLESSAKLLERVQSARDLDAKIRVARGVIDQIEAEVNETKVKYAGVVSKLGPALLPLAKKLADAKARLGELNQAASSFSDVSALNEVPVHLNEIGLLIQQWNDARESYENPDIRALLGEESALAMLGQAKDAIANLESTAQKLRGILGEAAPVPAVTTEALSVSQAPQMPEAFKAPEAPEALEAQQAHAALNVVTNEAAEIKPADAVMPWKAADYAAVKCTVSSKGKPDAILDLEGMAQFLTEVQIVSAFQEAEQMLLLAANRIGGPEAVQNFFDDISASFNFDPGSGGNWVASEFRPHIFWIAVLKSPDAASLGQNAALIVNRFRSFNTGVRHVLAHEYAMERDDLAEVQKTELLKGMLKQIIALDASLEDSPRLSHLHPEIVSNVLGSAKEIAPRVLGGLINALPVDSPLRMSLALARFLLVDESAAANDPNGQRQRFNVALNDLEAVPKAIATEVKLKTVKRAFTTAAPSRNRLADAQATIQPVLGLNDWTLPLAAQVEAEIGMQPALATAFAFLRPSSEVDDLAQIPDATARERLGHALGFLERLGDLTPSQDDYRTVTAALLRSRMESLPAPVQEQPDLIVPQPYLQGIIESYTAGGGQWLSLNLSKLMLEYSPEKTGLSLQDQVQNLQESLAILRLRTKTDHSEELRNLIENLAELKREIEKQTGNDPSSVPVSASDSMSASDSPVAGGKNLSAETLPGVTLQQVASLEDPADSSVASSALKMAAGPQQVRLTDIEGAAQPQPFREVRPAQYASWQDARDALLASLTGAFDRDYAVRTIDLIERSIRNFFGKLESRVFEQDSWGELPLQDRDSAFQRALASMARVLVNRERGQIRQHLERLLPKEFSITGNNHNLQSLIGLFLDLESEKLDEEQLAMILSHREALLDRHKAKVELVDVYRTMRNQFTASDDSQRFAVMAELAFIEQILKNEKLVRLESIPQVLGKRRCDFKARVLNNSREQVDALFEVKYVNWPGQGDAFINNALTTLRSATEQLEQTSADLTKPIQFRQAVVFVPEAVSKYKGGQQLKTWTAEIRDKIRHLETSGQRQSGEITQVFHFLPLSAPGQKNIVESTGEPQFLPSLSYENSDAHLTHTGRVAVQELRRQLAHIQPPEVPFNGNINSVPSQRKKTPARPSSAVSPAVVPAVSQAVHDRPANAVQQERSVAEAVPASADETISDAARKKSVQHARLVMLKLLENNGNRSVSGVRDAGATEGRADAARILEEAQNLREQADKYVKEQELSQAGAAIVSELQSALPGFEDTMDWYQIALVEFWEKLYGKDGTPGLFARVDVALKNPQWDSTMPPALSAVLEQLSGLEFDAIFSHHSKEDLLVICRNLLSIVQELEKLEQLLKVATREEIPSHWSNISNVKKFEQFSKALSVALEKYDKKDSVPTMSAEEGRAAEFLHRLFKTRLRVHVDLPFNGAGVAAGLERRQHEVKAMLMQYIMPHLPPKVQEDSPAGRLRDAIWGTNPRAPGGILTQQSLCGHGLNDIFNAFSAYVREGGDLGIFSI